jgi:hypothetical protein
MQKEVTEGISTESTLERLDVSQPLALILD